MTTAAEAAGARPSARRPPTRAGGPRSSAGSPRTPPDRGRSSRESRPRTDRLRAHAYADVHDALGDRAWMLKIAFAERHKHHRLVLRGTIAGRYVDIDDEGDATNASAVHGAAI